jgi:hypothetical protein
VASSTLVRTLSVTSQGEALIAGGKAVSQLGLSTVQYGGREPAAAQWSSELSQDGIAGAALAALFSDVNQSEPARLIAENIRLVLRIEPSPPGKCHLIGELIWLNAPASRPIDDLANRVINLTWTAKVGWSTSNAT